MLFANLSQKADSFPSLFIRTARAAKMTSVFSVCVRTTNLSAAKRQDLPEGAMENSPGRGPHGQVFVRGVEDGVRAKGENAILGK
jgi:hypothetical protein